MSELTRDQILNADDLEIKKVPVPEWGNDDPDAHIYIRVPRAAERDKFEAAMIKYDKDGNGVAQMEGYRSKFCLLIMCNASGDPIFKQNDIDMLAKKSSKVLDRLVDIGRDFTGIGAGEKEAEDAENFSDVKSQPNDESGSS